MAWSAAGHERADVGHMSAMTGNLKLAAGGKG